MATVSKITDHLIVPTPDSEKPFIVYEIEWPFMKLEKAKIYDLAANYQFFEKIERGSLDLNLRTARINNHLIFDLGPCEVVNSHQWTGKEPIEIKNAQGQLTGRKEPACWDVASVNAATGDRLLLLRTHAGKDEAFRVSNRMNAILNYARELCDPWEDSLRSKEAIPLEELQEALKDHPPTFGFSNVQTMTMSGNALSEYKSKKTREANRANDPASRYTPKPKTKDAGSELGASNKMIFWILSPVLLAGLAWLVLQIP